jgi:hypothetical protein
MWCLQFNISIDETIIFVYVDAKKVIVNISLGSNESFANFSVTFWSIGPFSINTLLLEAWH